MQFNRRKLLKLGGAILVVAAGSIVGLHFLFANTARVRYVTQPAAFADIVTTVVETGTVNPVDQVSIGSEVSGTVKSLGADFNSVVKTGEILATLDPTTYQALANSAQASLDLARSSLLSSKRTVVKMNDLVEMADLTLSRDEPLQARGLIDTNVLDLDRTAADTARQDYLVSEAQVQVATSQVGVALGQSQQAQFGLSKTVIRSPIDGIVMARNVSIGQTVAASLQTPTIFILATNLTDMEVDTSVDEADVGAVKAGEIAQLTVPAFPNVVFAGTVVQVRVNPTVVQNVVTYDAVVRVHDTTGRLFPGMTAQVSIVTATSTHVLSVPVAAVLYRPLAKNPSRAAASSSGSPSGASSSRGAPQATAAVAGAPGSKVTVWVLRNGQPVPVRVVIGLSDARNMQVSSGELAEGDPLVIAEGNGAAP